MFRRMAMFPGKILWEIFSKKISYFDIHLNHSKSINIHVIFRKNFFHFWLITPFSIKMSVPTEVYGAKKWKSIFCWRINFQPSWIDSHETILFMIFIHCDFGSIFTVFRKMIVTSKEIFIRKIFWIQYCRFEIHFWLF